MSSRRIALTSAAAILCLGLVAVPASIAWADSATPPSAPAAPPASPTVVANPSGTFTVTLPGVGSLSFAVDPVTGTPMNLIVAPVAGSNFTAGSPRITNEGVKVVFTSATSNQVLEVNIEPGASGPVVTAENDVDDPMAGDENNGNDDGDGDNGGVGADQQGDHDGGAPVMSAPVPTTTVPEPEAGDNGPSNGDDNGNNQGDDQQGIEPVTPAPAPVTATTAPSNDNSDSSGSGGSGDGGGGGSSNGSGGGDNHGGDSSGH
jgi:uncharacterized membrane protein YgcG